MKRFYIYKCVVDDGGAPCVENGLLTLCICKPAIRSTAREGNVIFAFGSNSESPANRLIYIAEVTRKLSDGDYYSQSEFQNRSDCIYELGSDGRFKRRPKAKYHASRHALIHDLGKYPSYSRANSLISNDFRYFGNKGTDNWKQHAPNLTRLVESLGQGHRVKHVQTLRDELSALKRRIWREYSRKVLGRPLHLPSEDSKHDELTVKVCGQRCIRLNQL